MDLPRPPNLERFIQEKVESGRYQTPSEVVVEALLLLKERDELQGKQLQVLRGEVQKGIFAIARGEHREYTNWRVLAEEIKAEGRDQSSHRDCEASR